MLIILNIQCEEKEVFKCEIQRLPFFNNICTELHKSKEDTLNFLYDLKSVPQALYSFLLQHFRSYYGVINNSKKYYISSINGKVAALDEVTNNAIYRGETMYFTYFDSKEQAEAAKEMLKFVIDYEESK